MFFCDYTLSSPAANLACDEALLDLCEQGLGGEVLRVWEPTENFVVVGYGNRVATEVSLPFCQAQSIPVLRRCTGGGAVLQGPGVLNYSLILRIDNTSLLDNIPAANRFILQRHRAALASLLAAPVEIRGQSDLAVGDLKFSGNAQRRRKHALLFHGSFLLHLDFGLMECVLPLPIKQPDYRLNRRHADFLQNLRVPAQTLKLALVRCWEAVESPAPPPLDYIATLTRQKYGKDEWNFRF